MVYFRLIDTQTAAIQTESQLSANEHMTTYNPNYGNIETIFKFQ